MPKKIPARSRVKSSDTWDLSSLYPDDDAWEEAFVKWEKQLRKYDSFRGTFAQSAQKLAACLRFDEKFDRLGERLGIYAFLKTTEDTANGSYQRMMGRYQHVASAAAQAASFIRPEILALSARTIGQFIKSKKLKPFRLMLERILRFKPHTLGQAEERLLAMQSEMSDGVGRAFRQLTDADMKFGMIKNGQGESIELSHATFASLLHSPKRPVRRKAFAQYYQ